MRLANEDAQAGSEFLEGNDLLYVPFKHIAS